MSELTKKAINDMNKNFDKLNKVLQNCQETDFDIKKVKTITITIELYK